MVLTFESVPENVKSVHSKLLSSRTDPTTSKPGKLEQKSVNRLSQTPFLEFFIVPRRVLYTEGLLFFLKVLFMMLSV